jgi:glycosyltransferase involved in cell wall biosynthesis
MKALLVNTPASQRFRGGDLTQMRKTGEALRRLGVEVGESFDERPDPSGYDIAHVFNLRTVDVTPIQVGHLHEAGVPVVLSPIYLNPSFGSWGTRTIQNTFSNAGGERELRRLLDRLAARTLKVRLGGGGVLSASSEYRPRADYDDLQRRVLDQVSHLLPNSVLEQSALLRTLRTVDKPFTVVPYAADPEVFLDADPAPFVERYGLEDFVLCVARVELSKNQVMLAQALRDSDVALVLIGGALQGRYLEWCREHGPNGLVHIQHLEHDELRSAYAAARVHALPSWIETCGMVTMEAALSDCSVVVSTAGYEIEYYRELAWYSDPADTRSIRHAVLGAYEAHDTPAEQDRRRRLRELILSDYTWERAAELTLGVYRRVLDGAG